MPIMWGLNQTTPADGQKRDSMTKTERKHAAQDRILDAMTSAYYGISDDDEMSHEEKTEALADLDVQRNRIGKLFGYGPFDARPW